MLPKQYRLTRTEEFRSIHFIGRSWSNSKIVLHQLGNELGHSRFGFSVSRKIGQAVVRNRVKRVLREVIHRHLHEIKPGWDIILVARRGMLGVTFHTTELAVLELLRLANVLDESVIKS